MCSIPMTVYKDCLLNYHHSIISKNIISTDIISNDNISNDIESKSNDLDKNNNTVYKVNLRLLTLIKSLYPKDIIIRDIFTKLFNDNKSIWIKYTNKHIIIL
jgi:hypothetical protein